MSSPREKYEDPIQGALNELVSAMSALNMGPDPILIPELIKKGEEHFGRPMFLTELDNWVKHSYEHLHAVFVLLNQAHTERELLKTQIFHMKMKMMEMRKGAHPH
jgi:hypothetical protein